MRCPYCGEVESKVVDSRHTDEDNAIRRRRECNNCHKRFTTYEKIEQINVVVEKKDGTREHFDREKILRGIVRSCEKRSIPFEEMEKVVNDIEKEIVNSMRREVSSVEIGKLVMKHLKDVDDVAYVRFASVYREFQDLDSFQKELDEIIKERNDRS
ncbi:transcriptional regulator NrdR [Filifactor villosus]|uniref:Transcriptional repressor NrdR n=1 Tax=Filifactor villosus TaxID=29374 RepID=A0ABV9QN01_9FIRM